MPSRFKRVEKAKAPPKDFKAMSATSIKKGMKVLHKRFGEGLVTIISGSPDNRIATIKFSEVGEKRIMLKYAKLGIVE